MIWRGFKGRMRPHGWEVVEGDLNLGVSNSPNHHVAICPSVTCDHTRSRVHGELFNVKVVVFHWGVPPNLYFCHLPQDL